jgi:hypothetical protein
LILVAGAAAIGAYLVVRGSPDNLEGVTADGQRLTRGEDDDGGNLARIKRTDDAFVCFRATLHHAPVGKSLDLVCQWSDPTGTVVHANHYATKEITSADWPTHARLRIGPTAAVGAWSVRLLLDQRELARLDFEVEP